MLDIYVFSYNRAQFLENCLASILRHAPGSRVRVFDDDSSDPHVGEVLERWRETNGVRTVPRGRTTEGLHGGLYNNMQRAYETGLEEGVQLALFIQDDMQLVRDITPEDVARAKRYFATTPNSVELHVSFFKRMYRSLNQSGFDLDRDRAIYFCKSPGRTAPDSFCDVGFFDFARMNALSFSFAQGEGENAAKTRAAGLVMGCYAFPFLMNLPFPNTVYYRSKQMLLRAAEWWVGAGFHPYEPMSAAQLARLFAADPVTPPEAEDLLTAPSAPKRAPWIFGGAIIGLIEIGGVSGWIAGKAGRLIKLNNDGKLLLKRLLPSGAT